MDEQQKLAAVFVGVLRGWASDDEWETMLEENQGADYQGAHGACASHNFCDANMAMDAAFKVALGREPRVCGEDQADVDLWNAAWSYAKAEYLTKKEG